MTEKKLRICAVTTTRADYGIMRPLLLKLDRAEWADLFLAVTGTHLLKVFGHTIDEIEKDGLRIDKKISIMSKANDSPVETGRIMSKTVLKFTEYFEEARPDVVLLLGDRFETFEVAAAATVCRIPVIHIAGGETTQGAIDEVFRHSITKMSYLHLASTEEYKNRIILLVGQDEPGAHRPHDPLQPLPGHLLVQRHIEAARLHDAQKGRRLRRAPLHEHPHGLGLGPGAAQARAHVGRRPPELREGKAALVVREGQLVRQPVRRGVQIG